MNILAVETSGREGSIALYRPGQETIEHLLATEGRRHAQTLVADADALLGSQQLGPKDTNCVAVSIGPGSFTGLRVGVVFAKTFGWINKCPVVAVHTFDAIAAQVIETGSHIVVVGDAQRGELFFCDYTRSDRGTEPASEVQILSVAAVRERLHPDTVLTGPGLAKLRDQFEDDVCTIADPTRWIPRASTVAQLGAVALNTGKIADPWKLEPLYIRRSAAEEKRDAGN